MGGGMKGGASQTTVEIPDWLEKSVMPLMNNAIGSFVEHGNYGRAWGLPQSDSPALTAADMRNEYNPAFQQNVGSPWGGGSPYQFGPADLFDQIVTVNPGNQNRDEPEDSDSDAEDNQQEEELDEGGGGYDGYDYGG